MFTGIIIGAVVGFVIGVLVYRNNIALLNKKIADLQAKLDAKA